MSPLVLARPDRSRLCRAMNTGEFRLAYQAQISDDGSGLCGFEVLLRWCSPVYGNVSPGEFIPLAEETGLIDALGRYALSQSLSDYRALARLSRKPVHVAVNVSPLQLAAPHFAAEVLGLLQEAELPARVLHLEVTESTLFMGSDHTVGNIQTLADAGVELWIDDFGTGYSSLTRMRDLPVSGLKIDQTFVKRLESSQSDFRIVCAIIAMAHSLHLRVVAEGVEQESHLRILEGLGCNRMQGYLIGRPMGLNELTKTWHQAAAVPQRA